MTYLEIIAGVSDGTLLHDSLVHWYIGTLVHWYYGMVRDNVVAMHHLTCYDVTSAITCNEYR